MFFTETPFSVSPNHLFRPFSPAPPFSRPPVRLDGYLRALPPKANY